MHCRVSGVFIGKWSGNGYCISNRHSGIWRQALQKDLKEEESILRVYLLPFKTLLEEELGGKDEVFLALVKEGSMSLFERLFGRKPENRAPAKILGPSRTEDNSQDALPFRLVIDGVFYLENAAHSCVVTGEVENGTLLEGDRVVIVNRQGIHLEAVVASIEHFTKRVNKATAGTPIGIHLDNPRFTREYFQEHISFGDVVYEYGSEPEQSSSSPSSEATEPTAAKSPKAANGSVRLYSIEGTTFTCSDDIEFFLVVCETGGMGILSAPVAKYKEVVQTALDHFSRRRGANSYEAISSTDMRLFCPGCGHQYGDAHILKLAGLAGYEAEPRCPKCSNLRALFLYDAWRPSEVKESDIESLKEFYKYEGNELIRSKGIRSDNCAVCGASVNQDEAYLVVGGHGAGKLECSRCLSGFFKALGPLQNLREDPACIGRSVLRNARALAEGRYRREIRDVTPGPPRLPIYDPFTCKYIDPNDPF